MDAVLNRLDKIIENQELLINLLKPKPKAKRTAKTKSTIPVTPVLNYFREAHFREINTAYCPSHGRDMKILKEVVGAYGEQDTKRLIDLYFWKRPDEWDRGKGYSVPLFKVSIPKLVLALGQFDIIRSERGDAKVCDEAGVHQREAQVRDV